MRARLRTCSNRIGFGPRPGDIERVQQQGLASYIDAQLHPDKIADAAMNARLEEFTTLKMSSRDLAEKYYLPAMELRRDAQLKQQKAANKEAKSGSTTSDPAMTGAENKDAKPAPQPLPPEVRQVQQAQANVPNELMQAKLLRAIESDRQLEEVLTDFWFNHFNVFVGKGQVREYHHRVRARRDPSARARATSASCSGATAHSSGDAVLSRQLAELDAQRAVAA